MDETLNQKEVHTTLYNLTGVDKKTAESSHPESVHFLPLFLVAYVLFVYFVI